MTRAKGRDGGQITAFVVVMTAALILVAGLVLDGGLVLTARVHALDQAQEAARSGARQLDLTTYRRTGTIALDPSRAISAAHAYLTAAGASGTIQATAQQVTVTVTRSQPTQILRAIGLTTVTVHATASAHPVRGITTVLP